MQGTPSTLSLHLKYRLWIAEMNEDITVLRIFDDHLSELSSQKNDAGTQTFIDDSKIRFANYRTEIDELKHEMHLNKMNLAAQVRIEKSSTDMADQPTDHNILEQRYQHFRQEFDAFKNKFIDFD